jgi:hypothetical protein
LDLRWLPGDLQTQLKSQANIDASNGQIVDQDDRTTSTNGIDVEEVEGFSSQTALKAIDERAVSDLPWWAESAGTKDWLECDGHQETESTVIANDYHCNSRVNANLTNPLLLAIVLLLGTKSPSFLASTALVLLSFVYLPSVIISDWKQRRSFVSGLLDKLMEYRQERLQQETNKEE